VAIAPCRALSIVSVLFEAVFPIVLGEIRTIRQQRTKWQVRERFLSDVIVISAVVPFLVWR
jgi:hypothetical protein